MPTDEGDSEFIGVPEEPIRLTVNPGAATHSFRTRLQHVLDVLAISIQGACHVDDDVYLGFISFFQFVPSEDNRLTREAASNKAIVWYLRNTFRDAIELTHALLEEIRIVAAVYRNAPKGTIEAEALERIRTTERKRFHSLGFPDKVSELQDVFGLSPKLVAHVLTINRVRNCLVHRDAVVGERDVDTAGVLRIRWRRIQLLGASPDGTEEVPIDREGMIVGPGWSLIMREVDQERSFALGDQVELSYDEVVHTMWTLGRFADELLAGLELSKPPLHPAIAGQAETAPAADD